MPSASSEDHHSDVMGSWNMEDNSSSRWSVHALVSDCPVRLADDKLPDDNLRSCAEFAPHCEPQSGRSDHPPVMIQHMQRAG